MRRATVRVHSASTCQGSVGSLVVRRMNAMETRSDKLDFDIFCGKLSDMIPSFRLHHSVAQLRHGIPHSLHQGQQHRGGIWRCQEHAALHPKRPATTPSLKMPGPNMALARVVASTFCTTCCSWSIMETCFSTMVRRVRAINRENQIHKEGNYM